MSKSDPRHEARVGDFHPDVRHAYDEMLSATMLTKTEKAEAFAFEAMRALDRSRNEIDILTAWSKSLRRRMDELEAKGR